MATIADTITQIKASNIDLNDKIYLSKSEDNIAYSLKMSELIKNLKSNIIPTLKDYNYYIGVVSSGGRLYATPNIQQKFGFDTTDTSQEFWDALANNVVHGNASRIQYGDIVYMPVTWNGWSETLWRVIDINRYSDHDLVFCPVFGGSPINGDEIYIANSGYPSNINYLQLNYGYVYFNNNESYYKSKYYNNRIGWIGCKIRCAFNGIDFKNNDNYPSIEPDWIPQVPALTPTKTAGLNKIIDDACGGHLRKISRHLHMYSNPHISGSLDRDEEVVDYVFLPKEIELWGAYGYGAQDPFEHGVTLSENQFKYYQLAKTSGTTITSYPFANAGTCTITRTDQPGSSSVFNGDYWCVSTYSSFLKQYFNDMISDVNVFPYWCFGTGN